MDQISSLRFKNLLDRLLAYCDDARTEEERAVLLRISVVTLNKLRIHADADSILSCDVVELTKQVDTCEDRVDLLNLWDDTTELVRSYREGVAT